MEDLYNIWVNGGKPADGTKLCGTMHVSGKLENLSCGDFRHFICEREPVTGISIRFEERWSFYKI